MDNGFLVNVFKTNTDQKKKNVRTSDQVHNDIIHELEAVKDHRRAGWKEFRAKDRFEKQVYTITVINPDGSQAELKRIRWVAKSRAMDNNSPDHDIELQKSRGIAGQDPSKYNSPEDYIDVWDEKMKLGDVDISRIKEFEQLIEIFAKPATPAELAMETPAWRISNWKPTGFCEMGFKYPRLLKHYGERWDIPTLAVDCNPLAVDLAILQGYNARVVNITDDPVIDIDNANVITLHHVLEHVPDPIAVLKKIYEALPMGGLLQVEIPIELDSPALEFGHMFGFHQGDLGILMGGVGFQPLAGTVVNIGHAYWIERITGIKTSTEYEKTMNNNHGQ